MAVTSASDAWAVGGTGSYPRVKTLIVHWNGTAWRRVPSPSPAGSSLTGVAATSGSRRLGGRLHEQRQPDRALERHRLDSGAQPERRSIRRGRHLRQEPWAVGGNLILHWDGTAWKQLPIPEPKGSDLSAVAASSPDNAWAVGSIDIANGKSLILHWNGEGGSGCRARALERGS